MRTYLKLALKVLRRRKFFTFISLFGISLTLVVLMVATAMLDNVFAARAPESRFDRVLTVFRLTKAGPTSTENSEPGYAFLDQYVRTLPDIERFAVFTNAQTMPIYQNSNRIETSVKRTDGEYWNILDFRFLEGGPFTTADDAAGRRVAVISEPMREKLFGGAPAVGKTFEVGPDTFTVIGVVPRVSITRLAAYADIWIPVGTLSSSDYRHSMMGGFHGMVLAHSRSDFPRLKSEFNTRLRRLPLEKEFTEARSGLDTTFEGVARLMTWNRAGDRAPYIMMSILTAIALLFMALPALNLITLNLSRILERASEIGVRKAFGAPKRILVWQFIVENVVLTVIGGALGFVLSVAALSAVTRSGAIPNAQFDVNLRIFFYGIVIAVLFGLLSGVYPAWRMARLDPVKALRGGDR